MNLEIHQSTSFYFYFCLRRTRTVPEIDLEDCTPPVCSQKNLIELLLVSADSGCNRADATFSTFVSLALI